MNKTDTPTVCGEDDDICSWDPKDYYSPLTPLFRMPPLQSEEKKIMLPKFIKIEPGSPSPDTVKTESPKAVKTEVASSKISKTKDSSVLLEKRPVTLPKTVQREAAGPNALKTKDPSLESRPGNSPKAVKTEVSSSKILKTKDSSVLLEKRPVTLPKTAKREAAGPKALKTKDPSLESRPVNSPKAVKTEVSSSKILKTKDSSVLLESRPVTLPKAVQREAAGPKALKTKDPSLESLPPAGSSPPPAVSPSPLLSSGSMKKERAKSRRRKNPHAKSRLPSSESVVEIRASCPPPAETHPVVSPPRLPSSGSVKREPGHVKNHRIEEPPAKSRLPSSESVVRATYPPPPQIKTCPVVSLRHVKSGQSLVSSGSSFPALTSAKVSKQQIIKDMFKNPLPSKKKTKAFREKLEIDKVEFKRKLKDFKIPKKKRSESPSQFFSEADVVVLRPDPEDHKYVFKLSDYKYRRIVKEYRLKYLNISPSYGRLKT